VRATLVGDDSAWPQGVIVDECDKDMRITVTDDGPYLVTGAVPLIRAEIVCDENGEAIEWRETGRIDADECYALCRCGHSGRKPFCDGSHLDMGFDGTETAGHDSYGELAVDIDGPGVVLRDARTLCASSHRSHSSRIPRWACPDRCGFAVGFRWSPLTARAMRSATG